MNDEEKKRVKLVRMPDGSMRPETETDGDIGDVWATQAQIRASEAQQAQLAKQQPKNRLKDRRQLKKAQKAAHKAAIAQKNTKDKLDKQSNRAKTLKPKGLLSTESIKSPAMPGSYRSQTVLQPKVVTSPSNTKEIAISLTIPKFKKPKLPKKHAKKAVDTLKSAPKWAYAVAALTVVPAFFITWGVVSHKPSAKKPSDVKGAQAAATLPDYPTISPNGDVTNTTSQKITYDKEHKVSSFTDKINGFEVTVSMQPLPDNFKPAIADNVKKVAEQFSATTVLNVDNGAAYLGTSAKGPQSFVGYRGNLLVFMKSTEKIDNQAWADYFNSLK